MCWYVTLISKFVRKIAITSFLYSVLTDVECNCGGKWGRDRRISV